MFATNKNSLACATVGTFSVDSCIHRLQDGLNGHHDSRHYALLICGYGRIHICGNNRTQLLHCYAIMADIIIEYYCRLSGINFNLFDHTPQNAFNSRGGSASTVTKHDHANTNTNTNTSARTDETNTKLKLKPIHTLLIENDSNLTLVFSCDFGLRRYIHHWSVQCHRYPGYGRIGQCIGIASKVYPKHCSFFVDSGCEEAFLRFGCRYLYNGSRSTKGRIRAIAMDTHTQHCPQNDNAVVDEKLKIACNDIVTNQSWAENDLFSVCLNCYEWNVNFYINSKPLLKHPLSVVPGIRYYPVLQCYGMGIKFELTEQRVEYN